jgi:eukaryotic-like serine/threonine-protein kinase
VLNACLAKDPEERWQTSQDLQRELQWIESGESARTALAEVPKKRQRAAWLAASLFLLVAVAAGWILNSRWSGAEEPLRFSIAAPEGESWVFAINQGGSAISQDGRILAFAATSQGKSMLWLRRLDTLAAKPLAGTEGAYYPFWSPDSRFVGFFAARKLKKIDIGGGLPQTLCDAPEGRGGTWNRDGVIVFTPVVGPAYRISAAGGAAAPLTKLDTERREDAHYWPYFLPDGRHFLYLARNSQRENDAIFVGSLDAGPETQKPVRLLRANSNAVYAPPRNGRSGYLLVALDRTLTARRFNATRLEIADEPVVIAEGVGYLNTLRLANFSVSASGILVYGANAGLGQFTWIGRDGKALRPLGAPANFDLFSLSPDSKRVASDTIDPDGSISMWIVDAERGTSSRFTTNIFSPLTPRWSPDSRQIAFSATLNYADPIGNIYRQPAGGMTTSAERLTTSRNSQVLGDWSGDGRFLVYSEFDSKTRNDLWVLPLSGERKPFVFLATPFDEKEGRFAPIRHGISSRWLAYTSDETGTDEVYVQSFPTPGNRERISTSGGRQARWRQDGKELFYLAPDGTIMGVTVEITPSGFRAEAPRSLCRPSFAAPVTPLASLFEVNADGQQFLILAPSGGSGEQGLNAVVNWNVGLKQ